MGTSLRIEGRRRKGEPSGSVSCRVQEVHISLKGYPHKWDWTRTQGRTDQQETYRDPASERERLGRYKYFTPLVSRTVYRYYFHSR